jgi:uncharacterized membrane protein
VTPVLVAVAVVVVVLAAVAVIRARRARRQDGVEMFRRQIDALSAEARRPVVDKVHRLEEEAAGASPAGGTEPDDEDRP